MENEIFEIVWGKRAEKQLLKIFEYIYEDSFQAAQKVVVAINIQVKSLKINPERYPPDKYKRTNPGYIYRCFTNYRYRVSYRIGKSAIKVIRIRHTKQKPTFY